MIDIFQSPLRLRLDGAALVSNWRWLARQSGDAACGAAIKADGYGLGAREVMARLVAAGCRDFFVATWAEAAALMPMANGVTLAVLHGVRDEDRDLVSTVCAHPVLNSLDQIGWWLANFSDRRCDLMIDTGMNRLGLSVGEIGDPRIGGLRLTTVMSHLACADQDSAMNACQLATFVDVVQRFDGSRHSLANSAGILLGRDYAFSLTRPGLALYGGIPRHEACRDIHKVVSPQAQILQTRTIETGATVGYGATFTAPRSMRVGIVNAGYADGICRVLGDTLGFLSEGVRCPVVGRISMDLIAVGLPDGPREGDWIDADYDLAALARRSSVSQYELLTGLGPRWQRLWST